MAKVIDVVLSLRDEASKKLKEAQKAMYGYSSTVRNTGRQIKRVGGTMESLGRNTLALTAPMVALGGIALKTGLDFDKAMSQVKAVSNATQKDFTSLREEALRIGSTTAKSASDAANGMIFLSQAGFKVNEVMKLSKPLVDLAVAGNIEMAQASGLLADSMNSANIPIKDASKYLDQVAKTSNLANTDISQLMQVWIGVGGSLRTANITMSESNALLAILAGAGIKGSEAGTSLSRIFMNLNATSGEASKAMQKLGISVADSSGKMRSKVDVLKELKEKTDKLSEAEKNQYIQMIGGKQYANDLKILLDGMGPTFDTLTSNIDGSTGALDKMSKTMADNLSGDITTFKSALEGALISISDAISPLARKAIKFATDIVSGLKNVDPAFIQIVTVITIALTAFGGINLVVGMFSRTIGNLLMSLGNVIRLFAGMSLGTLGVVAGVLAVVAVIYLLIKNFDKVKEVIGKVKDAILKFVDDAIGLDNIKNEATKLKNAFDDMWRNVKPIFKFLGELFKGAFEEAMKFLAPIGKVVASVLGFGLKTMLKVTGEIVKGVMQTLRGLLTFLSGLGQLISAVFSGDWKKAGDALKKMFKGVILIITGQWKMFTAFIRVPVKAVVNLASKVFHSAVSKAKSAWKTLKSELSKKVKGTITAVASTFTSIVNKVKRMWNDLKNFLAHPIRGTIDLIKNTRSDGSHKTGLGRVPFDGYRAELHKDEMVLTKSEADNYRYGRSTQNNKTVNVYFAKVAETIHTREKADIEEVASVIARKIKLSV